MGDSPILRRDIIGTELRADEAGRTVYGVCVPYGVPTEINDLGGSFTEKFERGSFAHSIQARGHKIKLMACHDNRRFPIGKATSLEERDDGLHGAFRVPPTAEGDDVLTLVREGVLDSFSIGFKPVRDRRERDGVVVRAEAALLEVSLVPIPAYAGATVAGIRAAATHRIPNELAWRRLRLLDLER